MNDGKGLYDNAGLIDTIVSDFNALPKLIIDNQFIKAAAVYASIGQRLANLKKGIQADTDGLKQNIEELKQANNELIAQLETKDGVSNGAD